MVVDFNAYLGEWWPGRELADGRPEVVKGTLRAVGVDAACVALMEGPWYRNQQAANEHLAEIVTEHRDFYLPLACLDPTTSYWPEDLEGCVADLGMVGVRLYPGYHHYYLDDEAAVALAREVGRRGLPLFVTLMIEEDRFAHPAVRTMPLKRPTPQAEPDREVAGATSVFLTGLRQAEIPPLANLIRQAPETTIVVSLALPDEARPILEQHDLVARRVYFDVGRMDKPTMGLDYLVDRVGADQLVLGTNVPFFYPEGAVMNLAYRSFPDAVTQSILGSNYEASPVLAEMVGTLQSGS